VSQAHGLDCLLFGATASKPRGKEVEAPDELTFSTGSGGPKLDFVHFQLTNRRPKTSAQEENEGLKPHQDQEVMWEKSADPRDAA
jgi:hypothetical protein